MVNNKQSPDSVRVMVIAETKQQRLAFSDTITKFNLTLVDCIAPSVVKDKQTNLSSIEADIWLVDSQYDDDLYNQLDGALGLGRRDSATKQGRVLVGFEQAPGLNEINLYAKWQRKLKRKLGSMLDINSLATRKVKQQSTYKPWQYVVLLAAGEYDTQAVQDFVDSIPSTLPITLLLIQQTNLQSVHSLPLQIGHNNQWNTQVISLSLNMQAGHCYIVPPQPKVVFDSTGRAIVIEECWKEGSMPCITQILENCSDAFGDQLISILFPNAQIDENLNIGKIKESNCQVWELIPDNKLKVHQKSYSAELPNHVGSSMQLAHHLTQYLT